MRLRGIVGALLDGLGEPGLKHGHVALEARRLDVRQIVGDDLEAAAPGLGRPRRRCTFRTASIANRRAGVPPCTIAAQTSMHAACQRRTRRLRLSGVTAEIRRAIAAIGAIADRIAAVAECRRQRQSAADRGRSRRRQDLPIGVTSPRAPRSAPRRPGASRSSATRRPSSSAAASLPRRMPRRHGAQHSCARRRRRPARRAATRRPPIGPKPQSAPSSRRAAPPAPRVRPSTASRVAASSSAATDAERVGVVGAALDRQRPLPRRRQHPRRLEQLGDRSPQPSRFSPAAASTIASYSPVVELSQPRVDVAANADASPDRAAGEAIAPAAAGCPFRRARPCGRFVQRVGDVRDQRVGRILARRHAASVSPRPAASAGPSGCGRRGRLRPLSSAAWISLVNTP